MNPLAPPRAARWIIGVVVTAVVAVPFVATLLFTLAPAPAPRACR